MTSINAQELFVHELGEIYDAEKCLIEAQQEWLSTLPTKTSRGRRPGEPRAGPPALAQCRAGSSLMGQAEIKRLLRRACSGRRRPARTPSKGPSSSCGRPGRKTLKESKGSWTRARTSSRANSPAHDEAPRGKGSTKESDALQADHPASGQRQEQPPQSTPRRSTRKPSTPRRISTARRTAPTGSLGAPSSRNTRRMRRATGSRKIANTRTFSRPVAARVPCTPTPALLRAFSLGATAVSCGGACERTLPRISPAAREGTMRVVWSGVRSAFAARGSSGGS